MTDQITINFKGTATDQIIDIAGVIDFSQGNGQFRVAFDSAKNAEAGTKTIWFDHGFTPIAPTARAATNKHSRCRNHWVASVCTNCACQWTCDHANQIDESDC